MNRTVEAIKNGQVVSTEELFEVVNGYVLTTLMLRTDDRQTVMSMQVNQFEKYNGTYKFFQKCQGFDDAMYSIEEKDIISSNGSYSKDANAFYISCKLKNNMELLLMIVNVSGSEEEIESNGFLETDIYDVMEFLEDVIHEKNDWYIILARVTDVFGFNLKMNSPQGTYIDTLDNSDWKLHISNDYTVFEVPVIDDSINLFYVKETGSSKEFIIKPYGQPFMEIRLLFFQKH